MAYKVIGPDIEGCNFSDYMVVDEDTWKNYVSDEVDELVFAGPFTTKAEAEKVWDELNRGEVEFQPNGKVEYFDLSDPGNFDGDYGPGSYYEHAMNKED